MDCQPSSAVNGVTSHKDDDDDQWNPEDCVYMLRRLEQSALSTLVAAMRAQGGLSEYREKVLNHVKHILHFTDAQMVTEMRRAAHDPCLMRISETLNPHYDTFSQWSAAGLNVASNDFDLLPESKREKKPKEPTEAPGERDASIMELADQLLALANQHNETVEESKDLARELSELPVVPYVPESMRILLRSTESDPTQRISLDSKRPKQRKEKAVGPSPFVTPVKRRPSRGEDTPVTPLKRRPGRRPKSESFSVGSSLPAPPAPIPEPPPVVKPEVTTPTKPEVKPEPTIETTPEQILNGTLHAKVEPAVVESPVQAPLTEQERIESVVSEVVAGQSPTASHDTSDEQAGCSRSSLSLLSDDPPFPPEEYFSSANIGVGGKLQRRKRSKPRDNSTCICARVQPFIFELQVPGKPKPPRGNPDRRTAKRPSPTSLAGFSHPSPILSPGGLAPQSNALNGAETPSTSSEAPTSAKTSPSTTATTYVTSSTAKTAHFVTPATYIKRARTVSSGDVNAAIAEGVKSTILRGHAQAAVPKGFVRSTNGTRLFVAQSPSSAAGGAPVATFASSARQFYGPVPVRASSVSSDGESSTSSAQPPSTTHIASLVTPGGATISRVALSPATNSPSKGAKSPAHAEGTLGGNEHQAPTTTFPQAVSVSGATIVKNAILKRSIITRHNASPSGARILASGPQILRRAPVQVTSQDGIVYTTLQPQASGGERVLAPGSSIVVRNALVGTRQLPGGERRTVTVVPTTLTAPMGTVANPILVKKLDLVPETTSIPPEVSKALPREVSTASSAANLLLPVECFPIAEPKLVGTTPERAPVVPSTSCKAEDAKQALSSGAPEGETVDEPEQEPEAEDAEEGEDEEEEEEDEEDEEEESVETEETREGGTTEEDRPLTESADSAPSRAMEPFEPEAPSESGSPDAEEMGASTIPSVAAGVVQSSIPDTAEE